MRRMSASLLVLDDEADMLQLVRRGLELDGYVVHTAASAEEAATVLRREKVDLLLLDLRLPGMSGLDLMRKLRNDGSQVRMVVISAHSSVSTVEEAMTLGAAAYLVKPFELKDLRRAVRSALEENRPPAPA